MKTILLGVSCLASLAIVGAQESVELKKVKLGKWGTGLDLAGDCSFKIEGDKLSITVPGSAKPHDLSTELSSATAPRALQPVSGDFTLQVKVEGEFNPGEESRQAGRTGYTGAGLVVFADAKNFIRLERATLHHAGDEPTPYGNFEIRVDGELERIGTTADLPIEAGKPTWLRLQRKGDQMLGAVSQDGVTWKEAAPKTLFDKAWKKDALVGVAAISTSTKVFEPVYSNFQLQAGKAAEGTTEREPEKIEKDK